MASGCQELPTVPPRRRTGKALRDLFGPDTLLAANLELVLPLVVYNGAIVPASGAAELARARVTHSWFPETKAPCIEPIPKSPAVLAQPFQRTPGAQASLRGTFPFSSPREAWNSLPQGCRKGSKIP